MLQAGVKIFELPRGMLHAKTATVDGSFSTVGSANLDRRSFRLNFEANAFFYGPSVARALEDSFEKIQADAVQVETRAFARRGRGQRALEAMTRILAPIL